MSPSLELISVLLFFMSLFVGRECYLLCKRNQMSLSVSMISLYLSFIWIVQTLSHSPNTLANVSGAALGILFAFAIEALVPKAHRASGTQRNPSNEV